MKPPPLSSPAYGVDGGAENQFTPRFDRAGYVVGGKVTREKGAGVMARPAFPPPEVVMPTGYERGGTVLEVKGKQYVVREQTEIAQYVAMMEHQQAA
jgi:hypothetical protein